jgi:ABC-type branched-subunit amino acid transport system ATPase component
MNAAIPPWDAVLSARGLVKRFGGIMATAKVSLDLRKGARHALIGPNGAGKTTLVNLLTGVLDASEGEIALEGRDITQLPPHERVQRGLVRTFQINQLFGDLTPLETLALAVDERLRLGGDWRRRVGARESVSAEIMQVAERFGLTDVLERPTDTLPYGKQRLLEIAAAFACAPKVLLLDEPAAGVPEAERRDILDAIAALPADVSVLLIEHDMDLVFSFARRISVLVDGALMVEGEPAAIAADPRVRAVYLGESRDG